MKRSNLIFLVFSIVLLSNCTKMKNEMLYMADLKKNISETYAIEDIDINILNENTLKISLNDSRLNNFDHLKKEEIAKHIGELSNKLRGALPEIKSGVLLFTDNSNYGIVKTSESESFNMY